MGNYLPVIEAVDVLHQQGLAEELAGDYATAEGTFMEAFDLLDCEDPTDPAVVVQQARIIRDDGFNQTRWALAANPDKFAVAKTRLNTALELTEPLVAMTSPAFSGEVRDFMSKRQRREAVGEHAATLGLLIRTVVAEQIAHGQITYNEPVNPDVLRKQYQNGGAYDLAKFGPDQYYAASIAMNGARIERANGRAAHVGPWLGRAAASLSRATIPKRQGLLPAVKTTARISKHLKSRGAAIDSFLDPQTV